MAFLTKRWLYNGTPAPIPLQGYAVTVRKAYDVYTAISGQKRVYERGRTEYFHENAAFPPMAYDEAAAFIQAVQNQEVWITYWDLSLGRPNKRLFYFGGVSCHGRDYTNTGAVVLRPNIVENISVEILDLAQDDEIL